MQSPPGKQIRPAFWAEKFKGAAADHEPARFATPNAQAVMRHPQAFGNYFSYGACAQVLGAGSGAAFTCGGLDLSDDWVDLGYMWSQLGAPESAFRAAMAATSEELSRYTPDLSDALREVAAAEKFKRTRGPLFDVLGTEGAQGGIGYTFLSLLAPGDEVLITDPGYMHFATAPLLAGARVRTIPLGRANSFRLDPDEIAAAITSRTKMLVVCDPINPFGTVQRKDELLAIADICRRRGVVILNNVTHASHQVDPNAGHTPLAALDGEADVSHVISVSGMSKSHALAGLRIGFLAGDPSILCAVAQVRMEVTGIHLDPFAQRAALAALTDRQYIARTTGTLRRNLAHLRATLRSVGEVSFAVEPEYGFSACLDVSASGVSAQELTVALFRQGVCVIAGDALGEIGATRYIRINYSAADLAKLQHFADVLPIAIRDARTGRYREGVEAFYRRKQNPRAARILTDLQALQPRRPGAGPLRALATPKAGTRIPVQHHFTKGRKRMISRTPVSFLSKLELSYGPLDVLGKFFHKADAAAKAYGIHLSFGTFEDLLSVNLANQDSWRAIIPTFDPRYSDLTPNESFCLLGYNQAGEIVATQACRLFKWKDTDFYEAAENLTLFYADPARDRRPGETCEVTAQSARGIRGRVAFSGAGWYRPDYRGKYLSRILPRISRAFAFTRWSSDYTTSMFQDAVLAGGMAERCGYSNIDWKVHAKGSPMGDILFAFVWMEPDELITDLRSFTDSIDTKVDSRIRYRRA